MSNTSSGQNVSAVGGPSLGGVAGAPPAHPVNRMAESVGCNDHHNRSHEQSTIALWLWLNMGDRLGNCRLCGRRELRAQRKTFV